MRSRLSCIEVVTRACAPKKNRVRGLGSVRELTAEQEMIVERARAGESLRVLALAGTGKTSTLIEVATALPIPGLYLAFNRAIADEARRKFPRHVVVKTAHALAYAALGYKYRKQERIENSTWALRQALMERFASELAGIAGHGRSPVAGSR